MLHHERIAGASASRTLVLTHGIYGSGANLRGIAKRLVGERPEWSVVLVDLPGHGRSPLGPPPYGLASSAEALREVIAEVGADAIAGHSFGGKVALATRSVVPDTVQQVWMLDATPSVGAMRGDSVRVLELMERLPRRWPRREDFVAAVVAEGHAQPFAQWLAMNVVPDGDAVTLRLDLPAIRAMLADYFARDLWSVALDPALPGTLEVMIADRSEAVSGADRARLVGPAVHVHHVDAGHWLHVEAPEAVVSRFAHELP